MKADDLFKRVALASFVLFALTMSLYALKVVVTVWAMTDSYLFLAAWVLIVVVVVPPIANMFRIAWKSGREKKGD
jgi:hypothetical protein